MPAFAVLHLGMTANHLIRYLQSWLVRELLSRSLAHLNRGPLLPISLQKYGRRAACSYMLVGSPSPARTYCTVCYFEG